LSGIDETQDGRHHLIQRDRDADLVIGYSPQQHAERRWPPSWWQLPGFFVSPV